MVRRKFPGALSTGGLAAVTLHKATLERGRLQASPDLIQQLRNRMNHLVARVADLGSIVKAHYYQRSRNSIVPMIDGKM